MEKKEIEKAIENGDRVWVVDEPNNIEKVKPISIEKSANRDVLYLKYKYYTSKYYDTDEFYYGDFEYFFKSQAEAEHYLHHANISRIEHLPFLTWEEFLSEVGISFISAEGFGCFLYYDKVDDMIYLDKGYETDTYGSTEANFYKAYDECVRLFKQE